MKKISILLTLFLFAASFLYAQDKAIDYKVLQSKIPNTIKGYTQDGDPDGMNMDMGGMSWSSATKEFSKGDKSLTVTIIDYQGASEMYTGFAMAWGNSMHFEDETNITGTTTVNGFSGVESYDKKDKSSTLILGVHDRYYVSIEVDEDLNFIKSVASALKLSSLPR